MPQNLSLLRLLVADDNAFTLRLIVEILKALGIQSDHLYTASNGRAALEILETLPIDIVITDALMEPVDGLRLTKAIRTSAEKSYRHIPIILCTAYSERFRVIKARDAGVTEVVAKPLSIQTLYDRICDVVNNPRSFIHVDGFDGPDRRRKIEEADEERRSKNYDIE